MIICVPFFFIISGYFTKDIVGIWANWKRFNQLFIPLIIWSIIFFILARTADFCSLFTNFSFAGIKDFILSITNFSQGTETKNAPLWFLRNLAFYALFSPILYRLGTFRLLLLICLCFVFPVNIYNFNAFPNLIFTFHGLPIGLAFYSIGILLHRVPLPRIASLLSSSTIIILLGVVASIVLMKYFSLPLELGTFFLWLCAFCLSGILLERTLAFLRLSFFIQPLVRSTFVCFACHYIIMQTVLKPNGITFSEDNMLTLIGGVLAIFLFSYFIVWLAELIAPKYARFIVAFPIPNTISKNDLQ